MFLLFIKETKQFEGIFYAFLIDYDHAEQSNDLVYGRVSVFE